MFGEIASWLFRLGRCSGYISCAPYELNPSDKEIVLEVNCCAEPMAILNRFLVSFTVSFLPTSVQFAGNADRVASCCLPAISVVSEMNFLNPF